MARAKTNTCVGYSDPTCRRRQAMTTATDWRLVKHVLQQSYRDELDYDEQAELQPMLTRALRDNYSRYLKLQQTVKRKMKR